MTVSTEQDIEDDPQAPNVASLRVAAVEDLAENGGRATASRVALSRLIVNQVCGKFDIHIYIYIYIYMILFYSM